MDPLSIVAISAAVGGAAGTERYLREVHNVA